MKISKLNAISSTNDYLKALLLDNVLENYTIVQTNFQTKGKGQRANSWHSKAGKNLLFSVLVRFDSLFIAKQAYLNYAISLAIYKVLITKKITVSIKWPNDIMAYNKKIAGILIENTVKGDKITQSIIGIGLNVNQINFPKELKNVTSLQLQTERDFIIDDLLLEIIKAIQHEIQLLNENKFQRIKSMYEKNLYKINKPTMFRDTFNHDFMGKIIGVSNSGKLRIFLEDETVKTFANKEIVYLYN